MSAIQTDCTKRSVCGSTTNPTEKEKYTTVMHLKGKTMSSLNIYKLVRLMDSCHSHFSFTTTIGRLSTDISVDSRPMYRSIVDRYIGRLSADICADISAEVTFSKHDPNATSIIKTLHNIETVHKMLFSQASMPLFTGCLSSPSTCTVYHFIQV